MYSRSRRGSNFLQESEQTLLRARRDSEWRRELASHTQLQSESDPGTPPALHQQQMAELACEPPPAGENPPMGPRGSVADTAMGAVRRLSRSLRRKSDVPSATSGLLPNPSMGPLASAGALCAHPCSFAACVSELLSDGGPYAVRFNSINGEDVVKYLNANPEVMNHYVDEYIDVPTIKGWLAAKSSGAVRTVVAPAGHHSTYGETSVEQLRHRLLDEAAHPDHTPRMLHELARVAAVSVGADAFTLFLIDSKLHDLIEYTPGRDDFVKNKTSAKIVDRETPAAYAASTGQALLIDSIIVDKRFLHGFGPGVSGKDRSALVVPLPGLAVLELRRGLQHEPFEEHHLETVNAILVWYNIAINKIQLSEGLQQQEELNSFLLEVAQSLFEDVFAQDALISKVMVYAKSLVSAERVTFFTMEEEKQELVASLFDDGQVVNGSPVLSKRHEIRFPVERGIAGYCARVGELVNVADAYADPRFNSDVDHKTGYKSRGLLAFPVKAKGRLLGVLQVVNKIGGEFFTTSDEAALRMFGIYCSLALYYGTMHDQSQKKEHQLSVALDMLEYHSTASPEELRLYLEQPLPAAIPANFDTFGWAPGRQQNLNRLYLHMYFDLVGEERALPERVVTFTTTVIKSYRRMPYHNSTHAFMVAHTMYNILKRNSTVFSRLEMLALLVACICHDVDHRGYGNTFAKASTSLGALYKVSVMENHHYATAASLLQRPGHDILSELQPPERKEVLDLMYEAIIATDLAVYFKMRPKLESAMAGQFNMHQQEHRRWFRSIMMTACDLSAVCKAPEVLLGHTLELYVEFHEQGDNEKKKGVTPDPMMDRSKGLNLPTDQINFVKYLCMPAYELVTKALPNTKEMLTIVKRTLDYWNTIKTEDASTWKPYPSWPAPVKTETRLNLPQTPSRSLSPGRQSIEATAKYLENFEIYMQTLISQALDANFLLEITQEGDEYFMKNVTIVHEINDERKKKIIELKAWDDKTQGELDSLPVLELVLLRNVPPSECAVCHQTANARLVQLYGRPYDRTSLQALEPGVAVSRRQHNMCSFCAGLADLYNKVEHQTYHLYLRCCEKVTTRRKEAPEDDSTRILNDILADETWLSKAFSDVQMVWGDVDQIYTAAKEEEAEEKKGDAPAAAPDTASATTADTTTTTTDTDTGTAGSGSS